MIFVVQADVQGSSPFCPKFRCRGNASQSRENAIFFENPPIDAKNLADIFYTSRVIISFVPNFVAMATGVGRGKMQLAAFDGPSPKTPIQAQKSRKTLLRKPSYSPFCPKFRCHGNGVKIGCYTGSTRQATSHSGLKTDRDAKWPSAKAFLELFVQNVICICVATPKRIVFTSITSADDYQT